MPGPGKAGFYWHERLGGFRVYFVLDRDACGRSRNLKGDALRHHASKVARAGSVSGQHLAT